jgi:hypothetical protein
MTVDRTDRAREIEEEVRRTQDEMGDTVQKLEEKLSPSEMARSVVGGGNADLAKEALEVTRQNPLPVALIAVGVIWLLATSRSPMIRRMRTRIAGRGRASAEPDRELRPRSAEPAPMGPPRAQGTAYDRRRSEAPNT